MKHLTLVLATIIILMLSFSCSGQQSEKKTVVYDSTALRIALLPTMECLPFYVAQQYGLFDSLGVQVRLLTYEASMDADTAFTDSVADACVTDLVKAILWRSDGDSIKVVMAADINLTLMTSQQARIKSATSIKEKIVAITRHSVLDYTADRILESVKMESEELNKPQINNIALRTEMLIQNQFDGALLPEPYASKSEAEGATRVIGSAKLPAANPMLVLAVHQQAIKERRAELALVVKAYNLAAEKIDGMAADHGPQLLACLPLKEEWPDSIVHIPSFRPAQLPGNDLIDATKKWTRSRTILKKDVNPKELVDSTFIKRP